MSFLLIHWVFAFLSCGLPSPRQQFSLLDSIRTHRDIDSVYLRKSWGDSLGIGFALQDLGPAKGISSITIRNDFIFISDNFFGNIKRLDVKERRIDRVSQVLSSRLRDLGQVIVSNDTLICLSTLEDRVFYLDLDLRLLLTKHLTRSVKEFGEVDDEVVIYSVLNRSVVYSLDLTRQSFPDSLFSYPNYKKYTCNGGTCIRTSGGTYKLPFKLSPPQYLDVKNIAYSGNALVYVDDSMEDYYLLVVVYF
jgi:hypothetical protein